jgi:nitrate/nitrite transporter NarK
MLPGGLLIDARGARRVVAAGSAVMGLGTLAMAVAETSAVLFTGRFVIGAGATVTFIGAMKLGAAWFPPERFGTISALTATVGVLGSLIANAPLAALVVWVGWRGAFWIIGVVTLLGAALCLAVVRDSPEGGPGTAEPAPGMREVLAGTVSVLKNPHTWPPFLSFFFLYSALGNLMLWVVPFLRDVYGLTMTQAAMYATATPLALLVSGPLTGWVSDTALGRRKLPYVVLSVALFAHWCVLAATAGTLPLTAVFGLLFGMGAVGSAFVLTWRARGESPPPGGQRGSGGEPGRLRRRRAHPGAHRRRARRAVGGRAGGRRARLPGGGVPRGLRGVRELSRRGGADQRLREGDARPEYLRGASGATRLATCFAVHASFTRGRGSLPSSR